MSCSRGVGCKCVLIGRAVGAAPFSHLVRQLVFRLEAVARRVVAYMVALEGSTPESPGAEVDCSNGDVVWQCAVVR